MYIIDSINTLLSALKLSQYRDYVKGWNKERYSEIFGDKDRIYLPDIIKSNEINIINTNDMLYDMSTILNIINNYAYYNLKNKKFKINNFIDYIKGVVYEEISGREYKIGKLLNEIIKHQEEKIKKCKIEIDNANNERNILKREELFIKHKNDYNRLAGELQVINNKLKNFNNRPSFKEISKNLTIVISRHPYDIAGMSTDRNWTSCMELPTENKSEGGCYHEKLYEDIKYGTLVAYLINEDDKNINKPLARIAIKPFYNRLNKFDSTIILKAEPKVYGGEGLLENTLNNFKDIINNWCDSVNKKIEKGIFEKPKELYDDSDNTNTVLYYYGDFNFENIINKILNSKDKIQEYAKDYINNKLEKHLILIPEITNSLIDLFYMFDDNSDIKLDSDSTMYYDILKNIKNFINNSIKLDNGDIIDRYEFLSRIKSIIDNNNYLDCSTYNTVNNIIEKNNGNNVLNDIFLSNAYYLIFSTNKYDIDYDKYDNDYDIDIPKHGIVYKKIPKIMIGYLIPANKNNIKDSVMKWDIDLLMYFSPYGNINDLIKSKDLSKVYNFINSSIFLTVTKKYTNDYVNTIGEEYKEKFNNIYDSSYIESLISTMNYNINYNFIVDDILYK